MLKNFLIKKQHILFPFFDVALNGFNYLFHVYASWYLFPSDYGILNSLLALSAILLVSGITFQTFTAKSIAAKQSFTLTHILLSSIVFSITISFTMFLTFPFLKNITRSKYSLLLFVIIIFSLNSILSVLRGNFQGKKLFILLNLSFYIEVGFKVLFLFFMLPIFKNVEIVLLSIIFGMSFSLFHAIFKHRFDFKFKSALNKKALMDIFKSAVPIYISNFFLYFFTSIDMIFINYFIPNNSGAYAVSLKYSQILLFVAFSTITVFIPLLSSKLEDITIFFKSVKIYFYMFVLAALISLVFFYSVLPLTVNIFFGNEYSAASQYIFLSAIAYSLLVMSFYFINVFIILGRSDYLKFLSSISILQILLFFLLHDSIKQIISIQIFTYVLLLFSTAFKLKFYKKNLERSNLNETEELESVK